MSDIAVHDYVGLAAHSADIFSFCLVLGGLFEDVLAISNLGVAYWGAFGLYCVVFSLAFSGFEECSVVGDCDVLSTHSNPKPQALDP